MARKLWATRVAVALSVALAIPMGAVAAAPAISFEKGESSLEIRMGTQPIVTYVWEDATLPRPYFEGLMTPDGVPVSRNHPTDPVIDKDNVDHPDFHPGAWLAFGDINGADFWRNNARVRHIRFAMEPVLVDGTLMFTVQNAYEAPTEPATVVCEEQCLYSIKAEENGYLMVATSIFRSPEGPFAFGDQEEMGFGVRVATPLSVRHGGGLIRNSAGGKQEAGTWGKNADWCAGFGKLDDRWVGINVMASPKNFRPAWFHSRDYGLIVANPFGKKAMTGPKDDAVAPDSTPVEKGRVLPVRFGLYVFDVAADKEPDFDGMYQSFLAVEN
tara:strand:- start:1985 stop:2968 length:984 start_codon:yes stop_codon:yes gene_type:complete